MTSADPQENTAAAGELTAIADGVERPLDLRYVRHQRVVGWMSTAALGGGSLMALSIVSVTADHVPSWSRVVVPVVWVMAVSGLAYLAQRWPQVEHRHSFYTVEEQGLTIRRGVYWRVVVTVPRSRVQHTDVSQSPLERRYGLGTLVVFTAGTDHAKVDLPGLDHGRALQIRDHLLPRTSGDAI